MNQTMLEPNEAPFCQKDDEEDAEAVCKSFYRHLAILKDYSFGCAWRECDYCHKKYLCDTSVITFKRKCLKCYAKERVKNEFRERQTIIRPELVEQTLQRLTNV